MDLKRTALQVECFQHDRQDIDILSDAVSILDKDADRLGDDIGVFNPSGWDKYDGFLRSTLELIMRPLERISGRRVDLALGIRAKGFENMHDLWIDPEPIPFDPTPPTREEGFRKDHGKNCSILPGCSSQFRVYQIRPELGLQHDRSPYKFHIFDMCPNCGTLFQIQ